MAILICSGGVAFAATQQDFKTTALQTMAQTTPRQRKIMGRVTREFEHDELKSGHGDKVASREEAIAIALHEAVASKYESAKENECSLARTERKEAPRGNLSAGGRKGSRMSALRLISRQNLTYSRQVAFVMQG